MFYQDLIRTLLKGRDYDPRHIEALMRLEYSTLDHLSREAFDREIKICTKVIDKIGKDEAEETAKSYGL